MNACNTIDMKIIKKEQSILASIKYFEPINRDSINARMKLIIVIFEFMEIDDWYYFI